MPNPPELERQYVEDENGVQTPGSQDAAEPPAASLRASTKQQVRLLVEEDTPNGFPPQYEATVNQHIVSTLGWVVVHFGDAWFADGWWHIRLQNKNGEEEGVLRVSADGTQFDERDVRPA